LSSTSLLSTHPATTGTYPLSLHDALPIWADAGDQRRRPRHAPRGDAARHARAGDGEVLLAPLQLPALLGRGGRLHARSQAPRHRSEERRVGKELSAWLTSCTYNNDTTSIP